ncbi:unnamed protein product [Hermetia illucens]|uniref:Proteasome maturation protein n=1 Tax=Hermetia illucens TaxID=343691 RepID=A0A7R8UGH4_HERIL|nr:proteasome maturation protein [Hermetia illucens]CAD7080127.1 unnamed protein product [Hermetia illucens]
MDTSIKVRPATKENFSIQKGSAAGPSDASCAVQIAAVHPLKQSEGNYEKHQQNLHFQMLRNREGLHAPLKLAMELRAANKVGRLPFLPSSNFQRDVLLGRDELVEFSDFLATEDMHEVMRQPHAVVERSLGIY